VKAHRGEPLNEGSDDLAEVGRPMENLGGRKLQVSRTDNTSGVSIQTSGTMKKRDMDQDHPPRSKERVGGISNGRATTDGGK
jgi:hypothetical protein